MSQPRREELYSLLGELPERDRPIHAEVISRTETDLYSLETLLLDLNGIEMVPAYFTRPLQASGKTPVVIYNHAHGGDYPTGKDEYIFQRSSLQSPPYADALAVAGLSGICIDTWNFGQRRGRTESELFKQMLWHGQVLWGLMIYDTLKVTDYVISRGDVDGSRIATMGLSMGSTMAWWHAALDERVKLCIDICCLTDFQALIETRNLDGHGLYYYVPSLLQHFTTAQINALICPRYHLSLAGNLDKLTPPAGLDRIDAELKRVYAEAGAPNAWELLRDETGHFENAHMRSRIMRVLKEWL